MYVCMILHQCPLTRSPLDQAGYLWWGTQGSVKRNKKQKDKDKTKDERQSESARDLKIHLKGN